MFHASHHIQPVPTTKEEIEAEASSVQAIARTLCPLKIILDRVFLTLIGVLLSCWQENQVTKRKEKSVSMNAFELISRSQSFNLDSFFEQQTLPARDQNLWLHFKSACRFGWQYLFLSMVLLLLGRTSFWS
nr:uncharacterized protein LOC112750033 isoform X2 [Arachis hypogaea]